MRPVKGFSLIELMIVSAIFVFLLGVILGFINFGNMSWQIGSSKMTVNQELRRGMEAMGRDLSQAKASTISIPPGDSSNSMSFQMARDLNNDGAISLSSGVLEGLQPSDPYIAYSMVFNAAGFNQLIKTSNGSTSVLANYLTGLQFTRDLSSQNIIYISLSGEKSSIAGHLVEGSLSGRLILRN